MYRMLLFDEAQYIRSKVKNVVKHFQIETYEAGTITQLNHAISEGNGSFDLILADLNFDNDVIIRWFENYIEQHPFTPLIIYTSAVTRANLASGLRLGAKDYILKSSDDDILLERVMKNIQQSKEQGINHSNKEPEQIVIDMHSFLNSEIRKAQKGNYEVSICLSSIQPVDSSISDEKLDYKEGSVILQKFKKQYWETDILFQYGSRAFVSFFPFCGYEQVAVVDNKLQSLFQGIKQSNVNLRGFVLVNSFVTFPHDGKDKQQIFTKLESMMK